jgi:hypothetical protein
VKGRKRTKNLENKRLKNMKKNKFTISALLSLVFLATILTTLILPIAQAIETHGHYTILSMPGEIGVYALRCDHTTDPPGAHPDNRFTGTGIEAFFGDYGYDSATYYYQRGYGGPDEEDYNWETYGSMGCTYEIDSNPTTYYNSSTPVYETQNWSGYYHPVNTTTQYGLAQRVGSKTTSWFKKVGESNYEYITSIINDDDMYWENPNWKDEEF